MTSEAIRDPVKDRLSNTTELCLHHHRLSAGSGELDCIDGPATAGQQYRRCGKAAVAYKLPIVHSTVNVKTGLNKPPILQVPTGAEGVPDL